MSLSFTYPVILTGGVYQIVKLYRNNTSGDMETNDHQSASFNSSKNVETTLTASFQQNIKAHKKLNSPQLNQLIELFKLSYQSTIDIGSWFIDQREYECTQQNDTDGNQTLIPQYISTLKFPEKLMKIDSSISIQSLLNNYYDIHSSIYKPLTSKSKIDLSSLHNPNKIMSYYSCIDEYLRSIHDQYEHDNIQFSLSIAPFKGLFSSRSPEAVLEKSGKSTLEVLAATIASMDIKQYNEIVIECVGDEPDESASVDGDIISFHTKPKPVTDDSYKYDGLIHKINAVPKDEGVLTFSYHLCPEFERVHLFYGQQPQQLGTSITKHNLPKVMGLLFDGFTSDHHEDTDDYKEESKRDYNIMNEPVSDNNKLLFIPKSWTEKAIAKDYFVEDFESDKQLFYVLRWRCRMHAIHGSLKRYSFQNGTDPDIIIFDTDLTCKFSGGSVYVCAVKNDKAAGNHKGIQKWQMNQDFVTADKIKSKYGIQLCDLPVSLKPKLKELYMKMNVNELIKRMRSISINSYKSLPNIKTNKTKSSQSRVHQIRSSELFQALQQSNDPKYFRPIISFKDGKSLSTYCVDMVCLVDIGNKNWIGIVFRAEETQNGNGITYRPVGIAVDCVDIRNKATLFEARSFNDNNDYGYQWINNDNISKLVIINDSDPNQIEEFKQQIEELKNQNMELQKENFQLKTENAQLKSHINELDEINNYYFQHVALNPNRNIVPHWKHSLHVLYPIKIDIVNVNSNDQQQNDDQKQKK